MIRVQRKREPGFRLPSNTLVVTRGTKYGNPIKMRDESERENTVNAFRHYLNMHPELVFLFLRDCEERRIEHIACFCPVHVPCHGDVWIEIWNKYLEEKNGSA